MSWDYRDFPRHPVSAEKFERRGRNNIISLFYYRVDPKLGKGVYVILWVLCAFSACVDQLDKFCLPNIASSSQPRYVRIENFTITNI